MAETEQKHLKNIFFFWLRKAKRRISNWWFTIFFVQPHQWKIISLQTRPWELCRRHWLVVWPRFLSPGNSVLPSSGRLQPLQPGCWIPVWTWLCGWSCGLARILIELCCQPCRLFLFYSLCPPFIFACWHFISCASRGYVLGFDMFSHLERRQ